MVELKTEVIALIGNISHADIQKVFANKNKQFRAFIDTRGYDNNFCNCK
jgi:hypothetical protein